MQRAEQNERKRRLQEVVSFLLGEAPLDGRWFGDDPPKTARGRPRPYWWRKDLREAADKILEI